MLYLPLSYCSLGLSLAKDQPRGPCPVFGAERGVWRPWRAVSSALAARKYWSLGLPVALQYCIAALVRLEIGPCCRAPALGVPPWHPHGVPTLQGAPGSHPNKPLRRQQQPGLGVVNGDGEGLHPNTAGGYPVPQPREHCLHLQRG